MVAPRKFLVAALLLSAAPFAQAGTDVALVNRLSGTVSHISPGGVPERAHPFMIVQQGDRFAIAAHGTLRVVYFDGGREEIWTGPASFRAATAQSQRIGGGNPQVAMLPPSVPPSLSRVPELIRAARRRGASPAGVSRAHEPLSAQDRAEVAQARETYRKMRAAAPADDVTPELYLFSVLQSHALYAELTPLAVDMRRRQPRSEEIRVLAGWARLTHP